MFDYLFLGFSKESIDGNGLIRVVGRTGRTNDGKARSPEDLNR